MTFDVFFSICQTEVDGYLPNEQTMWRNFFDQVKLADQLGYGTAWVAETHLSTEVQKRNKFPVVPQFVGEIGLNTDIFQVAHQVFAKTKQINVGSAIRNIQCNGGPIAHAEALKTFLSLHGLEASENRTMELGFAAGRFDFSNRPYGIYPRDAVELAAWPAMKGKIFREATEIFLRLIKGEILSSDDIGKTTLQRSDFRSDDDWDRVVVAYGHKHDLIPVANRWYFETIGVIPMQPRLDLLNLTLGAHDPVIQIFANTLYPCGVFNLSITPTEQIEETHQRMLKAYHPAGGAWTRRHMPRTVLIFLEDNPTLSADANRKTASERGTSALQTYWKAIMGTLDPEKIANAVENALVGTSDDIVEQIQSRFHPEDRLMLWFDFNNHNNEQVMLQMKQFLEKVVPKLA